METNISIDKCPKMLELFEDNIDVFNKMVDNNEPPDLRNKNLSGMDLSKAKLKGLDLSGSYLRNANLRGLDLTGCNLQGVSIRDAKVSGVLFPENLSAEEIKLSLKYGTRMRVLSKIRNNSDF